jgi:hypothetical protein
MKTPEELADEFANKYVTDPGYILSKAGFLAGYKAAQEQLVDASKVMPDTCEHILDMEKMVDVNGWISVDTRLPEAELVEVLVLISGDGWHDHDVAYRASGKWYDKYDDLVEGVTHWQELPKPPKEGK